MNTPLSPTQALSAIRAAFPQSQGWSVIISCVLRQYDTTTALPYVDFGVRAWQDNQPHLYECQGTLAAAVERILAHAEPAPEQPASAADEFAAGLPQEVAS